MITLKGDRICSFLIIGLVLVFLFIYPVSALGNAVPDLTISGISGPSSLQKGKTVTLQIFVQNLGETYLGYPWVSVYLSKDTTLKNGDDILIGMRYLVEKVPSSKNSKQWYFNIRENVPPKARPGTYYYGAIIDPNNLISEKKETNNQYVSPKPITIT